MSQDTNLKEGGSKSTKSQRKENSSHGPKSFQAAGGQTSARASASSKSAVSSANNTATKSVNQTVKNAAAVVTASKAERQNKPMPAAQISGNSQITNKGENGLLSIASFYKKERG